jgi:hypothetical protein
MAKDRIVMQSADKPAFGDQLPPKQVSWRTQMPRYVIEVDGQAKSGFETRELAEVEAKRISDAFPKLQVRIADWEFDSVRTLGPTQATAEEE